MSDSDDWFVGEDGSLNIGEPTSRVTYHSSLNTLLVATKDAKLRVIDVTSGSILQNSDLSASQTTEGIECYYLPSQDKLLFSSGYAVSVRKDLNGVMLLDTALQTPVKSNEDIVRVELLLPEAIQLYKSLMGAELAGVDHVDDVLREVETSVESVRHIISKCNHKVAKWATVCFHLPYFTMKSVCSSLVTELKRLHQNNLGLSVASALSDRLLYLTTNNDTAHLPVDRSLMYSEAARRETFSKWPHMNYKWALPDPMAKAGFYHQPNSTGDDRAMCFTCNVCLVCWEPTDEPWSEHERHSSGCPFVKGEHTQNVPLSVTYATEPASLHGDKTDKIACISTMSNCDMFATSTLHGHVVIWDCSRVLKKHIQFHIDPQVAASFPLQQGSSLKEPVSDQAYSSQDSSTSESSQESVLEMPAKKNNVAKTDAALDVKTNEPNSTESDETQMSNHVPDDVEEPKPTNVQSVVCATSTCQKSFELVAEFTDDNLVESKPVKTEVISDSDLELGHSEVIEVKGAWIKPETDESPAVSDVPLNEDELQDNFIERHRASHDVVVTALCVVGPHTSPEPAKAPDCLVQPVLISGVLIRSENCHLNSTASGNGGNSDKNEVLALNQVNQAISQETMPSIITEEPTKDSIPKSTGGQFMPYLLVHSINQNKKQENRSTKENPVKSCSSDSTIEKPKMLDSVYVKGVMKTYKPVSNYQASVGSSVAAVPGSLSSNGSQENVSMSVSGSTVSSISRSHRGSPPDGTVIQCITLLAEVGVNHHVQSITPTADGRHVIVVTAPKALDVRLSAIHSCDDIHSESHGGCIMVYKLKQDLECVTLDETPCRMSVIENMSDAVISLSLLPQELGCLAVTGSSSGHVSGSIVITTHTGTVQVVTLDDLKVVGVISPPEDELFISATFCTGIDRLCCCTEGGRLYFYIVGPRGLHMEDIALGLEATSNIPAVGAKVSAEDTPDSATVATEALNKADMLLVHQPLTPVVLQSLHSLTQFENLVPRFCATVPPVWNEIQQEQQHRRHPQHLQLQGDSTQHTHTWRLYPDSTSWDEHLFEMVIPKSCCVGHIDVKFTLFPLCTNVPHIQVTLLRQSMTKLGRAAGVDHVATIPEESEPHDVDARIDFNLKEALHNPTDEDKVDEASGSSRVEDNPAPMVAAVTNPVTTREFLDRLGAEILCGPVDLQDCVDMSGLGGVITLTGPELLKIKSRSFLLHIKAMINVDKPKKAPVQKTKQDDKEKSARITKSKAIKKQKDSNLSGLSSQDRLTALTSKQKQDRLKGCDWLQELSITVRRCKPVNISRERLERVSMLEDQGLHDRLLQLVCGSGDLPSLDTLSSLSSGSTGLEQRRIMALDILSWICSILMYAKDKRREQTAIIFTTETYLPALIRSCYMESNRSIAHQCTKFLTVLIDFSKGLDHPTVSTDFVSSLLSALLDSMSSIAAARSAGALHWYFVLLNRLKCLDTTQTGAKCVEMLAMVASEYSQRSNPIHALLKSRFGLYGHPLEPELFDVDAPAIAKASLQTNAGYTSYATVISNNNNNNNTGGSTTASAGQGLDETDFKDYLLLTSGEKAAVGNGKGVMEQLTNHVFGLLEVEPLHFTCHAASDGTRVERIDTVGSTAATNAVSGLSGTINFGADGNMSASGSAMTSLSAATEHQLSILNQKHIQLLKLQQQKQKLEQKLAESSKKGLSAISVYNNPELFPPTPKNTPFFMTPPVTPPPEIYQNIYIGEAIKTVLNTQKVVESKPSQLKSSFFWSQTQNLFQAMPPQALVIERLHSGARRFVVLDFGKPVLLTDVLIPGCGDLQSLSVDVWALGEDIDGHRLVVANDIGMRSLILNDLSPPPLCRFIKITTIGRHGGSAARSRIPLGSFYGHSFLFPWQTSLATHPLGYVAGQVSPVVEHPSSSTIAAQTHLMSQLGLCLSLHEDIQCRYSLACNRLLSLLNMVQVPHNTVDHTLYYLKQGKKVDDDKRILQAYHDCMSLQLQLNLAQWAIDRLQGMLSMRESIPSGMDTGTLLRQACTDKLRVLLEFLLDTLLGMTSLRPTIPLVPPVLTNAFTQQMCETVFRNVCVTGTKRMQIHAGVLLVRLCGNQPWWGDFLGNTIQEYFTSEQPLVFPRDRVFLVLSALSQKALGGSAANLVLESLVSLLGHLLSPLLNQNSNSSYRNAPGVVDQSLVSWLLLFLSRSLDFTSATWCSDDNTDKGATAGASREKESYPANRWDFLHGESSLQKRTDVTRSRKGYLTRQRGRFWHSKHQLHIQNLKKEYITEQANKALSNVYASSKPEVYKLDALNKTHALLKKQYKQYSSKHFKDLLNIRRTTGEYMRKRDKEDSTQILDQDPGDSDGDVQFVLTREKCIPVVKGLVALLLSTDFTSHVDLFIVACKVLARITSITRPVMVLSEIMSQSELDDLVLLVCGAEYNHGNMSWGGSWAGHTISCLLQDILDGEKMYGLCAEGATEDDMSTSAVTDTDTSLQNSTTLPTIDEDNNTTATTAPETSHNAAYIVDGESKSPDDIAQEMGELSMLLQDDNPEMAQNIPNFDSMPKIGHLFASKLQKGDHIYILNSDAKAATGMLNNDTFHLFKLNKKLGTQQISTMKANPVPQGVSTAMDARLELGVQLATELKLKMMLSADTENVQCALTSPLPPALGVGNLTSSYQQTDDDQLSEASYNQHQMGSSLSMLSTCFNGLFCNRVNMDTLLLLWLTLNEDTTQEENAFDSTRVPSIPLSETAVSSLLECLVQAPYVPMRTWVLAFQTLTLLSNLKYTPLSSEATSSVGQEKWLAQAMLADPNLMNIFLKFLSWSGSQGQVISSQQHSQVGPTAVKAFHEVLVRLQLRCAEDNEFLLRELLLRLVYQLSTDRGAFSLGIGPLDAQCKLLDHMLEQSYEKNVDINNAISVIESVSLLVHQHIMSHERVGCRSSTEGAISARSCFGGLFASVLRAGTSRSMTGDANRDLLMSNLLSLVNLLVQAPIPNRAPRRTTVASMSSMNEVFERDDATAVNSPMTNLSKINHSILGAMGGRMNSGIMTSTPNFPLSDEQKCSETDEQKTEHSVPPPKPPKLAPDTRKSCSHYWDCNNPESEVKDALLADFVLQHQHIMFHFLQALGYCHSNPIAMIIGSNGNINETFLNLDPLSVGDGIFQILCTMNRRATDLSLILKPIYDYLSSRMPSFMPQGVCQLSEPLLWFMLSVLDCEVSIRTFMDFGGVEVVCENLVRSTHSVISTSPGLVSTIMQYLGVAKGRNAVPRKVYPAELDNNETLQNFAPIGTITSSSPSAGPADVLIQGVAPHRRARSAAWSFNFYPHEAWVDLIITLPSAVLLREVHVQPHLASLSTCPSAVTLEVSRDGLTQIPITSPLITSGLNSIKIMLQKPEVATMVTIRLHKPRDSTTIGLSQLRLLGTTAFGDVGLVRGSGSGHVEDYVARTSMGWLRLLHHCLTQCEAIQNRVAMAATPVQRLLRTCTSLLLSSGTNIYITNIEAVLLTLGLHSADMGLSLIDHLLRNSPAAQQPARSTAVANESTVDLLYQLGIHQDQSTSLRVKSMIDWLGDSSRVAIQRAHGGSGGTQDGFHHYSMHCDVPAPAPAHIHCVAAVLWQSHDQHVNYDLSSLITTQLLSSMYEWSMVLPPTSTLKQAVDTVICSICFIHPEYFSTLLEWIGIIVSVDFSFASVTDDHKDSHVQRQEAMTDDVKANTEAQLQHGLQPILLQEFGNMMLDEAHLSTLAMACQSPISLRQLVGSNFLAMLCQGLYEFCVLEMSRCGEPVVDSTTDRRHSSSGVTGPRGDSVPRESFSSSARRHSSGNNPQDKRMTITADLIAPVLRFLAEISKEVVVKDWLGDMEGCVFWPVLLRLLCSTNATLGQMDFANRNRHQMMTTQQRSAMESATIDFFSCVLSCHHGNQIQFANILCEVIRGYGCAIDEYGSRTSPLCGFLRCLFLQVLLEDEKLSVCVRASSPLYKGTSNALTSLVQHPRLGAGHKFRVVQVCLHSTCAEIMAKLSDTPSLASQTAHLLEEKGDKVLREDWVLDRDEFGFDSIFDEVAATVGLHAKEKREKSSAKSPSPSRPPSRRGNRPSDALSSMQIPVLLLYHSLIPGQALPSDLTLSQLLVLLKQRGLSEGQASIDFFLKFKSKSVSGVMADSTRDWDPSDCPNIEPIPESILLETPSLPSALQVFASVGGLALLAEHLPLLYPEVTRQGVTVDNSKETATSNVAGPDWVTVDNADDIYEEIYESIPATQLPPVNKQSVSLSPSIPPHSLVAFGLFLRLPGYAEVLLKEKRKAQYLLRLVLGVTDDGEGGHILMSPIASALPTLPFNVLKCLFDSTPLSTDDGVLLRRMTLEIGAVHLVLACLSVLSHHAPRHSIPGIHQEIILAATQAASAIGMTTVAPPKPTTEERNQQYWAKGTGFGTGSTASYWDAEQALIRQKCEEEHVTCLFHVLASFVNPGAVMNIDNVDRENDSMSLPPALLELLSQSCLVPALCSYLRNDSVLDMARHVPLYRALLELLRGIAVCSMLVPLLLPLGGEDDTTVSISSLLDKMKICVDTYASRLKTNKKGKVQREDEESEGLALLIPDIQNSAKVVDLAVNKIKLKTAAETDQKEDTVDSSNSGATKTDFSFEEKYMDTLRGLQFDTYELVVEEDGKIEFTGPHHYESNVKAAGEMNNAARARRLAQEAVTLSTSLPLSASSSVFVRCDEERLDVMKVLITGPSDTPYCNGCFEFDVYFPQDYPNTPPQINLETTGNATVRFNPNLYNDGKVCLSILNTWHGRPEEKWNAQTSSFLQVLVSIQSLILVSEPYFNEPGYERSRGTASGTSCSKEYDANIRQATVKWAMLEMLRNPPACFKEVIECHFWMKRHEILRQIELWISDLEANTNDKRVGRTITHSCVALKRHYSQLKEELTKMKRPENIPGTDTEVMLDDCQSNVNEASASIESPVDVIPDEQNQVMPTSTSGQALLSMEFEIPDQDFAGFSSDSDSDSDIITPAQAMMNNLDGMSEQMKQINMNSISPASPPGEEEQQNAMSVEVPKSMNSDLYYL